MAYKRFTSFLWVSYTNRFTMQLRTSFWPWFTVYYWTPPEGWFTFYYWASPEGWLVFTTYNCASINEWLVFNLRASIDMQLVSILWVSMEYDDSQISIGLMNNVDHIFIQDFKVSLVYNCLPDFICLTVHIISLEFKTMKVHTFNLVFIPYMASQMFQGFHI